MTYGKSKSHVTDDVTWPWKVKDMTPMCLGPNISKRAGDAIQQQYDTIGEFNVDWKAEYSALSSTRSQKKKLKQPTPVPL